MGNVKFTYFGKKSESKGEKDAKSTKGSRKSRGTAN